MHIDKVRDERLMKRKNCVLSFGGLRLFKNMLDCLVEPLPNRGFTAKCLDTISMELKWILKSL